MRKRIWAILSLIWIALIIVSPFPSLTNPQPVGANGYVIEGNSVYVQTKDTYIRATPHTLTDSGWVTINFSSSKIVGDVDIVFGFNGIDQVQTIKAETFNATWIKTDDKFTKEDYYYSGASKWSSRKYNITTVKDTVYTARFWVVIPTTGNKDKDDKYTVSGKYNIAIKPSSSTISQAMATGNMVVLDPWYSVSWQYRIPLPIIGTADGVQTNYQMKRILAFTGTTCNATHVSLDSKCNVDFSDVRFSTTNGTTLLDYWVESYTASVNATVWVEVNSIPVAGTTIYIYYGNATAAVPGTSQVMGTATFSFFDDFDGAAVDDALWTIPAGTAVAGSVCTFTGAGALVYLCTDTTWGDNYAFESYIKSAHWKDATKREDVYMSVATHALIAIFSSNDGAAYNGQYINYHDGDGGWGINQAIVGWSANVWYIISGYRHSQIDWEVNRTNRVNNIDHGTWINAVSYGFEVNQANSILYIDWVFIRKYTTNEPTWGVCGAEELCTPVVVGLGSSNVEETTATLTGNVTDLCAGCGTVTARGFAWGTTSNTTMAGTEVPVTGVCYTTNWTEYNAWGTGPPSFTNNIIGLTPATCYYWRAYASSNCTNNWGSGNSLAHAVTSCNAQALVGSTVVDHRCWRRKSYQN